MIVLLVDEDDDFRSGLAENLRDDGHRVDEFAAPAELHPLEERGYAELLVTEFLLSGEGGLSFIDRFHVAHPAIPVVIVTSYTVGSLAAAISGRANTYLRPKPIEYLDFRDFACRLASSSAHLNRRDRQSPERGPKA